MRVLYRPFAAVGAALVVLAAGQPSTSFAQTQVWGTTTIRDGGQTGARTTGQGDTRSSAAARASGLQGVNGKPGVQVYGTTGTIGQGSSSQTVQGWSTVQGGTTYYGNDGQVLGYGPNVSPGPVYVPVPVPYPQAVPGYPSYPQRPPHWGHPPPQHWPQQPPGMAPNPTYPSPPMHRSEGHPYGPNVVPGWGAQPAPDYRNAPQRNQPGYYVPR